MCSWNTDGLKIEELHGFTVQDILLFSWGIRWKKLWQTMGSKILRQPNSQDVFFEWLDVQQII
jgi:hypothetical protein